MIDYLYFVLVEISWDSANNVWVCGYGLLIIKNHVYKGKAQPFINIGEVTELGLAKSNIAHTTMGDTRWCPPP